MEGKKLPQNISFFFFRFRIKRVTYWCSQSLTPFLPPNRRVTGNLTIPRAFKLLIDCTPLTRQDPGSGEWSVGIVGCSKTSQGPWHRFRWLCTRVDRYIYLCLGLILLVWVRVSTIYFQFNTFTKLGYTFLQKETSIHRFYGFLSEECEE